MLGRSLLKSREKPNWRDGSRDVKTVDLFSGCGGLSLGAADACASLSLTFAPTLAVDSDEASLTIYEANFGPEQAKGSDIRQLVDGDLGSPITADERNLMLSLRDIDLLLAGPPCQGHSDLNNHTRRNDCRNGLYVRVARFAEVVRPNHVLIENVPTVIHSHDRVVERTIEALESLDYSVDHGTVDMLALGVPQKRRRHVLVASLEKKIELQPMVQEQLVDVSRTVRWAIDDLEEIASDETFDTASKLSDENRRRIDWLAENGTYDLPNSLRPPCHQDGNHSYGSMYGRLKYDLPAQTVTTGFGSPGQGRYIHPTQKRTITPHEAARLQMFPDYFDFSKVRQRGKLAKMIGNAVPMPLSHAICLDLLRA